MEAIFFIPRQIWFKKHKSQVLKMKNKTETKTSLLYRVMQIQGTIHLKENKSISSFHSKTPTLQMSYKSHVWKAKDSSWFTSSVAQQMVTVNTWSSQLVLASVKNK